MSAKLSEKTQRLIVEGLVRDHWDSLKSIDFASYVKAMENEEAPQTDEDKATEGEIMAVLSPIADQLVAALNVEREKALAMLVQMAASVLGEQAGETTDATAMMEEGEAEGEYMGKGVKRDVFRAALMSNKGAYQVKNVSIQRHTTRGDKEMSLAQHIRAVASHDYGTLNHTAKSATAYYKALGINPDTAGGYLVPPEQAKQVIEILRAKAVILNEVTVIPLNRDTMGISRQTGSVTTNWLGENAAITASEQTFGQVTLVAKKLSAMVKISNEFLADSDPDVDAFIRDDIAKAMADAVDQAIFLGAGNAGQPLGLLNMSGVTKTALSGALTYENLVDEVKAIEAANVDPTGNWKWVWHPYGKAIIRQLEDTEGHLIWAGDGYNRAAAGNVSSDLLGYPWAQSTLTGLDSNSRSRIYFGNWSDVVVGMRKTIEIVASNQAGTAFEYDQTWIRAIMRLDLVLRHDESIRIITAVQ